MMITKKASLCGVFISILFFSCASFLLYQQAEKKSSRHQDIDSKAYLDAGRIFHDEGSFASLNEVPYYALGYPLIIGLTYQHLGYDQTNIIIIQYIIALLCGLIIFLTTRTLFGITPAVISALLFAGNVGFLTFTQFILTELWLTFFLLLFFFSFVIFLQNKKSYALILSGLFLGMSLLIKPAALFFPIALIPLIAGTVKQNRLKHLIMFLGCFFIPLASYVTHNKLVFNSFCIGSLPETNLLFWFYPNLLAEKNGTSSHEERALVITADSTYGRNYTKEQCKNIITTYPALTLYTWIKNCAKTWLGLYTTNLKRLVNSTEQDNLHSFFTIEGSLVTRCHNYITGNTSLVWVKTVGYIETISNMLRMFLLLIALVVLLLERRFSFLCFFILYISYFSLITGHDGCARFRMMFEGPLLLVTAYGLWLVITKEKRYGP